MLVHLRNCTSLRSQRQIKHGLSLEQAIINKFHLTKSRQTQSRTNQLNTDVSLPRTNERLDSGHWAKIVLIGAKVTFVSRPLVLLVRRPHGTFYATLTHSSAEFSLGRAFAVYHSFFRR